ncbi:hypothetical protein [Maritalea porphyrae]|uniref:hypothetical protein n=1 Tax=Maritalea porphyrae TaxID=880732 RepID=UPI0022AED76E|nr:hypothetical protein [Maritalea porphyrae]MCZ4273564.1 hypothetical protein [Maritalea porphyrae]
MTKFNQRFVRAFCIYDFMGLGLFALPIVSSQQVVTYSYANQMLGGMPLSVEDPFAQLSLCLLGLLVIAWGIWRWMDASPQIAFFEGCLRFVYGPAMLWFGIQFDMPIFALAGIADLAIGLGHMWSAKRAGFSFGRAFVQTIS